MDIDWHKFLIADYETGVLSWRSRAREHFASDRSCSSWNARDAGKIAGYVRKDGYRMIGLLGRMHLAHRIIYEMANGPIRDGYVIDHWDRNPRNNSLSNLREVTNRENGINSGLRSDNTSGVKGVRWNKARGKWHAHITYHGRVINLGFFRVFEDAVAARRAGELLYLGYLTRA